MATVNVLNQMAEYDFNAPIDVEMIFEDSDNEEALEPAIPSALSDQENINDNNNIEQIPVETTKRKTDSKKSENQVNNISLNKSMLSLNENGRVLQRKPSLEKSKDNERNIFNLNENDKPISVEHYQNQNESDSNQPEFILINSETVNNEERSPSTCQTDDHNEPVTTFIEDLLNKLSEHIVLIMQSFYHYGVKKNNQDNKKREEVFHFIKSHFFELSYSTVESIFLPQEQNENFINQFLDNTVLIANNKALRWKCHRGHVLPFFKELMTWTKQKKDYTEKNKHPPCSSNRNILLKQQLIRPLLPLNLPQSEIVASSNTATQNIQNNLCIFTSGPPGSEISINVDANTLIRINERPQSTVTPEQTGSNNSIGQAWDSSRRKKPVRKPTNRNPVKDIQKKNPKYGQRPPPPPYHINHNTTRIVYRPQQYNQTNMNPLRNYYNNMRPPQQNHQNIRPPNQNYSTQVHYINTNHTSPPHNDSLNYVYDTHKNVSMNPTQMESQGTCGPVISNVTSLDPNVQMYTARCYMCGKKLSCPPAPSYSYNSPCTPVYCSYLCQELDSQFYKPAWGNT